MSLSRAYTENALVQNRVTATDASRTKFKLNSIELIGVASFLIGCAWKQKKNLSPNLMFPFTTAKSKYTARKVYKLVPRNDTLGCSKVISKLFRKGCRGTPSILMSTKITICSAHSSVTSPHSTPKTKKSG